jgi:predicted enzyme related to lactoylglutathione lyase
MELNQVTLPSGDVARGATFYRRLGLVQIVENLPSYARFELPIGGATLSLHLVESFVVPTGVVVYLECEDLDGRVAALQAEGIVFDTEPTMQPWLWREAHLRDPDGNVLCLFHAGVNRQNPPWRLSDAAKPLG